MSKGNKNRKKGAYKPAPQQVMTKPIQKPEIPKHVPAKAARLLENASTKKGAGDVFKKEF